MPRADSQGSSWNEMTLAYVEIGTANSGNLKARQSECTRAFWNGHGCFQMLLQVITSGILNYPL